MFSVAARSTFFFGGILTVQMLLLEAELRSGTLGYVLACWKMTSTLCAP